MENRYALFHVALMLNVLILGVSFTGVICATMPSITTVMKVDRNLSCKASQFLYDLEYTKRCASLPYLSASSLSFSYQNLDTFLCLGIYDTAYKVCQYSNSVLLPQFMEEFIPSGNSTQESKFCNSLQGFTSSYDKIDLLLKSLVEHLNKPNKCSMICFGLEDKLNQVCALFAWIKKIDDKVMKKANGMEKDPVTSDKDKPSITQSNETVNKMRIEADKIQKKIETIETNENKQNTNSENNNNDDVGKDNLNVSTNLELENEKAKSVTEKSIEHKKILPILPDIQTQKSISPTIEENRNIIDNKAATDEITKFKDTPTNSKSQVSSTNNLVGNVPNKDAANPEEEIYKEQNTDDLKTSTLSENTQDNYNAANQEDVEDVEDTIQQSTRNQNENIQEVFEQKNVQYPSIRTEDGPHFFTYFTVVTVACIAGYIGYHNKQKILAIVLEGRRSRNNRGRRRPSTANYRKLDCTLEEAVTSQCNANVTHVIY